MRNAISVKSHSVLNLHFTSSTTRNKDKALEDKTIIMKTSRIHLMGIQSGLISAVKGLYNCVPSSIKDSNKLMFFAAL